MVLAGVKQQKNSEWVTFTFVIPRSTHDLHVDKQFLRPFAEQQQAVGGEGCLSEWAVDLSQVAH